MPGASLPNLAGAVQNPLLTIGTALAQAPTQAADQEAALNQKGWQTIQPYIIAASRNPNLLSNNAFVGQMHRIAAAYRISGPLIDQAIDQTRSQLGGAQIGMSPAGTTSTGQGGGAVQTGPAQVGPSGGSATQPASPEQTPSPSPAGSSSQPTTKPVGSSPDLGAKWQDPQLKQRSEVYNQDLEAAARTPRLTSYAPFQAKLRKDGMAVGRNAQEIAADIKAYQLKSGTGPHLEHMPADQAARRFPQQQAGSAPTPAGAATAQTQPAASPQSAPGSAAEAPGTSPSTEPSPGAASGPVTYDGPRALPPAMQALMAAAGVSDTGMKSFGQQALDSGTAQRIAEAQPADRPQLYAMAGIDPTTVPNDIINAKSVMTETQRGVEWQRVYNEAQGMIKEGQDPTGIIQGAADAGVITHDMAQAFLSEPDVMRPLVAAAQQNAQILTQNGLLKGERFKAYQAQIATAQTTQDLNRARQTYLGKQTTWYNSTQQARVAEAWAGVQKDNAEVTAIKNGTWFQQGSLQGRNLTDQIRDAQTMVTNAQNDYNTLLGYGKTAMANFQDVTSLTLPDGTNYAQALQEANERLGASRDALRSLTSGAASTKANTAINAGGGGSHVKQTGKSPYGQPVATDKQGRNVYKHGSQYVYADGTPYQAQ